MRGRRADDANSEGLRRHNEEDVVQQPAEGFAFFRERLALGGLASPMRRTPITLGTANTVFFPDEFKFPAQGLIDRSGGPGEELDPSHWAKVPTQTAQNQGSRVATKCDG
jgi:hypothetical protein